MFDTMYSISKNKTKRHALNSGKHCYLSHRKWPIDIVKMVTESHV